MNQTYANTVPLVDAAGLPLTPGISMPNGWNYFLYGPGDQASNVTPMPPPTANQTALLTEEYTRYAQEWATEFAPLYTAPRYTVIYTITRLSESLMSASAERRAC